MCRWPLLFLLFTYWLAVEVPCSVLNVSVSFFGKLPGLQCAADASLVCLTLGENAHRYSQMSVQHSTSLLMGWQGEVRVWSLPRK